MNASLHRWVVVFTLCTIVSVVRIEAASPAPGSFVLYPERIVLKAGGFHDVERGVFFVPANRSKPDGRVVSIEVYRFKASEKADPNAPPIFWLPGGPRFTGLAGPLSEPGTFERRYQPFLDHADLVVVSQRGIGPSQPSTVIETTTAATPLDQPYDDAAASEAYRKVLAREKEAWEAQGVDLSGFAIDEAAADVNFVRAALGYEKIVVWGRSFGSHWGMAVMRYHPEIVERAVLRAMEGPDHTYDHPGGIWNVYKRVAEEAEAHPTFEGFIPEGGLIAAIEGLVAKVAIVPARVTVRIPQLGSQTVLIDGPIIRHLARGYSGSLAAWPSDIINLYAGSYGKAAVTLVKARQSSADQLSGYREASRFRNAGRTFLTASYFGLDCGSGISAKRQAEYDADPANDVIGEINWKYKEGCKEFENDMGEAFRQNFETEIPTVIVHGTWDLSTPYENALELLPYFKNSKFVTVKRGPHDSLQAAMRVSEEFTQAIWKFATTGDMSALPDEVEIPVEWVVPR